MRSSNDTGEELGLGLRTNQISVMWRFKTRAARAPLIRDSRSITQPVTRSRSKTEWALAREKHTQPQAPPAPPPWGPGDATEGTDGAPDRSAPLRYNAKVAGEWGALHQGKEQPGMLRSQTS